MSKYINKKKQQYSTETSESLPIRYGIGVILKYWLNTNARTQSAEYLSIPNPYLEQIAHRVKTLSRSLDKLNICLIKTEHFKLNYLKHFFHYMTSNLIHMSFCRKLAFNRVSTISLCIAVLKYSSCQNVLEFCTDISFPNKS